ncbi:MAG: hypothetical protein EZS28_036794 [Streblomastix strix]|uniref:Uncharacterized protein n=1 Tax=Streblomastix strix TaxID=222440 RepID=A0A5J4UBV9_9EUKA|nr:MAG: hypothetical protein EZS28_036794 [Streblomastix strix]
MFDKTVLVEELVGEQPAKDDRIEIKANNKVYRCINIRMRCKCDQRESANQKDIQIMGSQYGEFELARDTGDILSCTGTETIYQPIRISLNNDRISNTTACFSTIQASAKYYLRKAIESIVN